MSEFNQLRFLPVSDFLVDILGLLIGMEHLGGCFRHLIHENLFKRDAPV